ncbi:MAG: hypothetical protein ACRC8A_12635 [Microcoleaceae cyanobacterium]
MSRKTPKASLKAKKEKQSGAESEASEPQGEPGVGIVLEIEAGGIGVTAGVQADGDVIVGAGIGIIGVDWNFSDPYNSTTSYFGDLFEFTGEREGCRVRIDKYIKGVYVTSEYQTIPECEDEEKEEEKQEDEKREDLPPSDFGDLNPGWEGWKPGDGNSPTFPPNGLPGSGSGYAILGTVSGAFQMYREEGQGWRWKSSHLVSITCVSAFKEDTYIHQEVVHTSYGILVFNPEFSDDEGYSGGSSLTQFDRYRPTDREWWHRILPDGSGDFYTMRRGAGDSTYVSCHKGKFPQMSGYFQPQFSATSGPYGDSVSWAYPSLTPVEIIPGNFNPARRAFKKPPPVRLDPPMDCCDELMKLVSEIHECLAAETMLDKGITVPSRLITAGGVKKLKLENYLDLLAFQIRAQDHLGIHPFKASLSDANPALAGDQKIEIEFANATSFAKKLTEMMLESDGESAARLNLQIRIAIAVSQILNAVSIISKGVQSIASFVGMPIREKRGTIEMPFDPSLGARKRGGFALGKKLDINTEKATEQILPEFMQNSKQPYVYEDYDGARPTLLEQLRDIGK